MSQEVKIIKESTENLKTLVLITRDTMYYAKGFGFDGYQLIPIDELIDVDYNDLIAFIENANEANPELALDEDDYNKAINVRDITSWSHHLSIGGEIGRGFEKCFIDPSEVLWSRVPLVELITKHDTVYAIWDVNDKSEYLAVVKDYHDWIRSFPIPEYIQELESNEVDVDYCGECNSYKETEEFQCVFDKYKGTQHLVCGDCNRDQDEFGSNSEI